MMKFLCNMIEVLRMPDAPNASYHLACYTPRTDEVVIGLLQTMKPRRCEICGNLVSEPPGQPQSQEKETIQLSLWS